jgi:hypothetical protein
MTDLAPIAKCALFEYIEAAPIPAEKTETFELEWRARKRASVLNDL